MIDWDSVGRLVVAVALGAAVGLERESADQPAGLRTHIAVALGASLFGVVSTLGFEEFFARRETTNIQVDVTRVASQVVVGIGFIGAGMIFRQGGGVRNLTTAASLWVTSAIGLAAGVGELVTATIATVATLASLVLLRPMKVAIQAHLASDNRVIRIELRPDREPTALIDALRALTGVRIEKAMIEKQQGDYVVIAELRSRRGVSIDEQLTAITARDDVLSLAER